MATARSTSRGPLALQGIEGHVVLVGFGRVGRTIGAALDAEGTSYVALDVDPTNVAAARSRGLPIFFGDASRPEMLKRVHIEHAAALVATLDGADKAERIGECRAASDSIWSFILARARHCDHAARLLALGTNEVVPEILEASLQIASRVLQSLGLSEEVALARIAAQRSAELAELIEAQGAASLAL